MLLLLALLAAGRVQLTLDASEAEAVLAGDLQRALASEPYRRLKEREKAIAERFHEPSIVLTDEKFRAFLATSRNLDALAATLQRWKSADLDAIAARILAYLPSTAQVHAKIYPVIKPAKNSFVWDVSTDPAIFLYLDPKVSRERFENTVAHELHHIGLASAIAEYDKRIAALPERRHAVAESMEAFGEGLAMLAAAGGLERDPMPSDPAQWARDQASFADNLRALDAFFTDALTGSLTTRAAIEEKAGTFYGQQGPWYSVGYRMAVIVEKKFGRAALVETMLDPPLLLVRYNAAARDGLPRWSESTLAAIRVPR